MIRIQPYNYRSRSARELSRTLGVLLQTPRRLRIDGDRPRFVINWGSTAVDPYATGYLNDPAAVACAASKVESFEKFKEAEVPTVPWTTEREVAQGWFNDGATVIARTLTRANSGRGIVVCDPTDETTSLSGTVPAAPLYTKYVKKACEYRVHASAIGDILDVQQKRLRSTLMGQGVDTRIRNHAGGFVFVREGCEPRAGVLAAARRAVLSLGLAYGAVDVGWNDHFERAYVYEVNTAPGLEGSTPAAYLNYFTRVKPELRGGAYQRRRA